MAAHNSFRPCRLFALALGLLAAACAAQYPIVKSAPPPDALIRVDDPLLRDAKTTRVQYLGAFDHVAYARFETRDLTLEAVYVAALSQTLVLDYDYGMDRMIDTWNVHRDRRKRWGETSTIPAAHGTTAIQTFSNRRRRAVLHRVQRGMGRTAPGRPGPPRQGAVRLRLHKTGRLDFASPHRDAAVEIVRQPAPVPNRCCPCGRGADIDQAAFDAARGTTGGKTGNAEFPFDFGTTQREAGPGA